MHSGKAAIVLTAVLFLEGGLFYTARGLEKVPTNKPLEFFPMDIRGWQTVRTGQVDKETEEVLRADDTLTRWYASTTQPVAVNMFVAYFRTQRAGQTPHSPKNCLPGAGWEPVQEGYIQVPIAGEPAPITINRYLVAQGDVTHLVLYWYQGRNRVIASDYAAKFWLVVDSIRYHRSDTAIVRVEVPIAEGGDDRATKIGVEFVQALFPALKAYLPA